MPTENRSNKCDLLKAVKKSDNTNKFVFSLDIDGQKIRQICL